MAVFGDYETIDPPLFMSGRHGHVRTYWLARPRGAEDGPVFVIKSVALPKPKPAQEEVPAGRPSVDPSAFAESVARLREAYRANPELIAPVHASGETENELWYATDYYPRRSLAEFESTAKDITNNGLAHVVSSLATACLTFQRATGRSHGNLKAGNVLLAGQPGPLKSTPLRLSDPAGSPASQASTQHPKSNAHAEIRDATEILDLRGIGQIILQLVESNPIEGPEDYTLPIETSAPWRALGQHSERWLDLCNRLLDPGLSLDEIRLDSLVTNFGQRTGSNRKVAVFLALGMILVGGIASFPKWSRHVGVVTDTPVTDSRTADPELTPAANVGDGPALVQEGSRQASTPSRLAANDSVPMEQDNRRELHPPADMFPSAESRVATPHNRDAGIAPIEPPALSTRNNSAGARSPTKSIEPTTQEITAQPADSEIPARGSLGESTSSSTQVTGSPPQHTEIKPENTHSKPEPVPAPAPALPSRAIAAAPTATQSTAGSGRPDPNLSQAPQEQRVPSQQRAQYADPKSHRAASPSAAARAANNSPNQANLGRSRISRPLTAAKPEARTSVPARPVDAGSLDRQLRKLESEVGRVVAVPRNSEFFTRLNSLEAQYAKANRLSGKTKKRLDLLRSNLTKKMPGPSPEQPLPDPLFAPSPTPYPVGR